MQQNYFLFDKVLPFLKTGRVLDKLNLYQIYFQRFGIGKTISSEISKYSGSHYLVKMNNFKENDINISTKLIFIHSEELLDIALEKKMLETLQQSIDLYDYRGSRYKAKLPINGQRRRANARTAKRIRPIIVE
jgi:small subunit ribosomal protein S13